jgi:tetratricopeptide (TPR) repeat protein
LRIILKLCAQKKTPVVISNLVSNVRDLPPFHSLSPDLPNSARMEYERAIALGDSLLQLKRGEESIIAYSRALMIDSSAASLWFKLGKAYDAMGDSTRAAHHYYQAKDRDLIRFRASEEVNTMLSKTAVLHKAGFVDMQRWFADRSTRGLIGANLMCDHLHPNPDGYYLMARAFYDHIVAADYLNGPAIDFQPANSPYFVSDLDWDIGLLKIFEMIHRWPFPEKPLTFADYQPHGDLAAAEIAREYLFVENVWSKAKYKMAAECIKRNELEKARDEYLGVSLFAPDDPDPYLQVAKTYEMVQDWPQREAYLKLALALSEEKGKIQYQIALAQWRQKKLDEAIVSMSAALRQPDLNFKEKQNAGFYLAGFYADAQNFDAARQALVNLLRDDPNFQPAKTFLHRLMYEQNQAITTR